MDFHPGVKYLSTFYVPLSVCALSMMFSYVRHQLNLYFFPSFLSAASKHRDE